MPPHLHPRSTATSTLFAGTLLASFVVVGIPHVFPCPRPRQQYLDTNGKALVDSEGKLVVRQPQQLSKTQTKAQREAQMQNEAEILKMLQEEARVLEKEAQHARECPIPKPRGWFGKVLGFEEGKTEVRGEIEPTKT
jgi:hypothetical protein